MSFEHEVEAASGRVLIAAGNMQVLELVTRKLESAGLDVVAVGDALRAVTELGRASQISHSFDVLVVGQQLLDCAPLDLLWSLRRADWQIPVILIAAFGSPALRERAHRLGAIAVFEEPIRVDDLLATVLRAMSFRLAHA